MFSADTLRAPLPLLALLALGCAGGLRAVAQADAASGAGPAKPGHYEVTYSARLEAGNEAAQARITVGDGAAALRELRFRVDPARHADFEADGELTVEATRVTWRPPASGGSLRYVVRLDHRRDGNGFDARMTDDWALFRGGDLFPPAATRTLKGAQSRARLVLELPDGWSAVTPYREVGDNVFPVSHADRRFDRPTGWILVGRLGIRRDVIADTRVAVAAPRGQGLRRMDILAMLRWNLPVIREVFPAMDGRLTVVGARDGLWRGGLSGPGSLYLHADRPLISENGTSTLLHEVVHVAMGVSGAGHDDWVVEGLAEFYAIEAMARSGTLGPERVKKTYASLRKWGNDVDDLFAAASNGAVTARATVLMAALDRDLKRVSEGKVRLDDVVRAVVSSDARYTYASLCRQSRKLVDALPRALVRERVPGAPDEDACRDD